MVLLDGAKAPIHLVSQMNLRHLESSDDRSADYDTILISRQTTRPQGPTSTQEYTSDDASNRTSIPSSSCKNAMNTSLGAGGHHFEADLGNNDVIMEPSQDLSVNEILLYCEHRGVKSKPLRQSTSSPSGNQASTVGSSTEYNSGSSERGERFSADSFQDWDGKEYDRAVEYAISKLSSSTAMTHAISLVLDGMLLHGRYVANTSQASSCLWDGMIDKALSRPVPSTLALKRVSKRIYVSSSSSNVFKASIGVFIRPLRISTSIQIC